MGGISVGGISISMGDHNERYYIKGGIIEGGIVIGGVIMGGTITGGIIKERYYNWR